MRTKFGSFGLIALSVLICMACSCTIHRSFKESHELQSVKISTNEDLADKLTVIIKTDSVQKASESGLKISIKIINHSADTAVM